MYLVIWKVDIDKADVKGDIVEAVKKARSIQLDPESTATVFEVIDQDSGEICEVDLGKLEPSQICRVCENDCPDCNDARLPEVTRTQFKTPHYREYFLTDREINWRKYFKGQAPELALVDEDFLVEDNRSQEVTHPSEFIRRLGTS